MLNFLSKDKPVKIRFYFDAETNKKRFTVFDKITIEKYLIDTERVIILMSHFMVDDKDQPIPEDKAFKTLERLNQEDFADVSQKFINGLQESALPNPNGSDSNLPSAVGQVETLPTGLQR